MADSVSTLATPAPTNIATSSSVTPGSTITTSTEHSSGGNSDHGASHESHESGPKSGKPSKVSFDLGDGLGVTEIDLGDGDESSPESGSEFKFADLDTIKETHADLYKSLKAELSKATRYSKFGLKSPEDYKAQVERIERLSGGKGLDGLESSVSHMAQELQNFRSGDVTTWAKDAPEEFGFAAAKIADSWGAADPKGYIGHVAKAAIHAFTQKDSYGQSALDAFNAAYAATTDPNTKKLLDRVAHTLDNINQNSQYVPDQTAVKERQLAQRENQVWNKTVDNETGTLVRTALSKALSAVAGDLQIDADDRQSYMADMESQWYEAAKADKKFCRALDAAGKAKDLEEIKSLVKANRQAFAAEAAKAIYRSRISKLKGNLKKEASSKVEAGGGGSPTPGTVRWTGKIDARTGSPDADFDFARMKAEDPDMLWQHQFYIKGKKEKFSY